MNNIRCNLHHLSHRWIAPVLPIKRWRYAALAYARYLSDWFTYSALPGSEPLRFVDSYPFLFERTATTYVDAHYFYQDIWAFKLIQASGTPSHVDVGSRAIFVGVLTAITKVIFIDIRPLVVNLENFYSIPGSVLALPFSDNSISSISCLHVAEHIGLGRYGDPLDPEGTRKATRELTRVLAPQGSLYFSVPVGKPRLCFNAHRIHSPQQILGYFQGLKLVQFSGIDDKRIFKQNIDPSYLTDASYACGLFHLIKQP